MLPTQEDSAGGTADPHYVWRTVALRNGPLEIFISWWDARRTSESVHGSFVFNVILSS